MTTTGTGINLLSRGPVGASDFQVVGTGALLSTALQSTTTSNLTVTDGNNIVLGTSTGTKIGTGTTQKLAFYNSAPLAQQAGTVDLIVAIKALGLMAAGTTPLTVPGAFVSTGAATLSSTAALNGDVTIGEGKNVILGTTTGTQIGSVGGASGQKLGFWGAAPAVQPVCATGSGKTVDQLVTILQTMGLLRQS